MFTGRFLRFRSQLRSFATKTFARPVFFGSRGSNPQLQGEVPPRITPSEVAIWVVFGAAYHAPLKWAGLHLRDMHYTYLSESLLQEWLEELERKKKESPEAYVKMLHMKIMAVKSVLSGREDLAVWEKKRYIRTAAVLESKLNEWIQGQDTVPVPQGIQGQDTVPVWQSCGFI